MTAAILSCATCGAFAAPARTATKHSGRAARVQVGLDVLESEKFAPLRGKHVGLITNHTGLDAQGRSTVDLLSHAAGVQLVALFSPEHGLAGNNDDRVASTKDAATGLPIYSLYAETRRPTDAMLQGIDTLIFDVQDAGVRFYTYVTTMGYCMEEAAKRNIAFYVLDRPNPIGGTIVEGTSGNTGMGLALVAAVRGYKMVFTITDKQSKEKVDLLKAFGAEVIVCPTAVEPDDPRSYYSVAKKLAREIPNSFYPNQY